MMLKLVVMIVNADVETGGDDCDDTGGDDSCGDADVEKLGVMEMINGTAIPSRLTTNQTNQPHAHTTTTSQPPQ